MIDNARLVTNEQDLIFLEKTGYTLDFLYKKYYPKLIYNLNEKCRCRDKSEEYANDAFFMAMNKIDQYDEKKGEFSTWLFAIAHNVFLIDKNKEVRDNVTSMDVEIDGEGTTIKDFLASDSEDTSELEFQNINILKAKILIKNLSYIKPEYAEVIRLRDIEERSYKEITEILNINMNTLKSRIRNARLELIMISQHLIDKLDNLLF